MEVIGIALTVIGSTALGWVLTRFSRPDNVNATLMQLLKEMRQQVDNLSKENKELQAEIGDLKTLVAVMLAESGAQGPEKEKMMMQAKRKLGMLHTSIDYIKEGETGKALEVLLYEVTYDDMDDVIALTGNYKGITKSYQKGTITQEHFEKEMARIRVAATELALKVDEEKKILSRQSHQKDTSTF